MYQSNKHHAPIHISMPYTFPYVPHPSQSLVLRQGYSSLTLLSHMQPSLERAANEENSIDADRNEYRRSNSWSIRRIAVRTDKSMIVRLEKSANGRKDDYRKYREDDARPSLHYSYDGLHLED